MRYLLTGLSLLLFCQTALAAEPAQKMTVERASEVLSGIEGEVVSVTPAEIPGFYQVGMKMQDKTYPLYIDESGSYLFSGNIIRIADRTNLTEKSFRSMNPVNTTQIPEEDALLLGSKNAKQKIYVFTDPHCPYCSKLHKVLHEAIKKDPSLAFLIKIVPFKASSKEISKTIVCNKSMQQLEDAFAGKSLPKASCTTDVPEQNLKLAQKLGIRGTPTLIMPDGQIYPGYRPLPELLKLIAATRPK